jgi:hypothetical protein
MLRQSHNHLVDNRNFQSIAVIVERAERSDGTARSLLARTALGAGAASCGRDATTSPFDFPRAPASYVRAGGNARCRSTVNGDLHGSYHVECV